MFGFGKSKKIETKAPSFLDAMPIELTEEQMQTLSLIEADSQGFLNLGDVTRNVFGRQVQYISHYFDGVGGAVDVTTDLRVTKGVSYHEYRIHREDVSTFFGRVLAHKGRI